MAVITRVNHTGISVADIDRSLTFYRDLLGLELVFDSDVDDIEPLDLGLHKTTYIRGPDKEIIEILEDRATPDALKSLTEQARQRRAR